MEHVIHVSEPSPSAPEKSPTTAAQDEIELRSWVAPAGPSVATANIMHGQAPDDSLQPPATIEAPLTPTANTPGQISKLKSATIIITLAGMTFLNTMGSGILISALPRIATDLGLSEGFLLWPASIYSLAAGCVLLISGAVADVVGAKLVWVTGSFLYVGFTVAVGLSRNGVEIILFRTLLGIAVSMCLPTAVSLVTNTFAKGNWRNVAFATIGMGQPLGFSVGLLLGGIFTDTIGWRWSFFVSAIINSVIAVAAIWSLPSVYRESEKEWTRRLAEDIDWIGALALSAALGILLYVLATTTSSYHRLGEPQNIVLLVASVILLGVFPLYMEYQVRHGRPAIIPNSLWKNGAFTATCISVFLAWAAMNAIEYFATLVFQRIQSLSALQSSLRFLPHIIMGVFVNIGTGLLISRVKVRTLAVTSGLVALIGGPLMATIDVHQSYWLAAFWAMLLSPVSCDVLFIVANLVISDAYPTNVQSLAGGVLNEVGQFGNSVGLAVTAAIAASVTEHSKSTDSKDALMQGYRASFWAIFTATAAVVGITFVGLKKGGLIGKKEE